MYKNLALVLTFTLIMAGGVPALHGYKTPGTDLRGFGESVAGKAQEDPLDLAEHVSAFGPLVADQVRDETPVNDLDVAANARSMGRGR